MNFEDYESMNEDKKQYFDEIVYNLNSLILCTYLDESQMNMQ